MQEIYDISWRNSDETAVAMGYFDAVHIGHKFLIDQMKSYAKDKNLKKAIFTFTKNIELAHKGKDIATKKQKLAIMEDMGIDIFYSPDFSIFANLSPEEFVDYILVKSMKARAIFCGENFLFGKNRTGNIQVLKELCVKRHIEVIVVPTVIIDNETVSSSLIRKALEQGNIKKANTMLGRAYYVDFEVVHGKSLGRTLGTPTINQIYPQGICCPMEGVYISKTTVSGKSYYSATGFGTRPTVNGVGQSCETFIGGGFSQDIYNKEIKVEFYEYLFPSKKFENVQQLKDMILIASQKSYEYLHSNNFL